MAKELNIIRWPDDILKETLKPFDLDASPRLTMDLVDDMLYTMEANEGVGLAANQIGLNAAMFVARDLPYQAVFNPKIINRLKFVSEEEGCLSCPGLHKPVRRHRDITLTGYRLSIETDEFEPFEENFTGYLARVIQHETDHLNGLTILQRRG